MDGFDDFTLNKALVSLAIERALLEISKTALEEVGKRLYLKYQIYFADCFAHPQYLAAVLEEIYGNAHVTIVKLIKNKLEEFSQRRGITEFLAALCE